MGHADAATANQSWRDDDDGAGNCRGAGGGAGNAFLSVGAAASSGLGYGYSPIIAGGVQTAWVGPIAFRAELQRFTRGDTVSNDCRLLLGVAIGFGR